MHRHRPHLLAGAGGAAAGRAARAVVTCPQVHLTLVRWPLKTQAGCKACVPQEVRYIDCISSYKRNTLCKLMTSAQLCICHCVTDQSAQGCCAPHEQPPSHDVHGLLAVPQFLQPACIPQESENRLQPKHAVRSPFSGKTHLPRTRSQGLQHSPSVLSKRPSSVQTEFPDVCRCTA